MLTLAEILGRNVDIHWWETVGAVRETVERIVEAGGAVRLPDLHQVALGPSGRVEVLGGSAVADSVQRLGETMQTLLSRSDPPVQLRLLIAQATGPGQPYESLQSFSDALGFFERPGRTELLQDLYTRAAAAPPLAEPPVMAAPARASAEEQDDLRKAKTQRRTQRAVMVVAAVALIGLVGVAAWLFLGVGGANSNVSAATARAAKGLSTAVSAIGQRVRGTRPEAKAAVTPEKPEAPPPASAKRRRPAPVPPSATLQTASLAAFDLTPVPLVETNGHSETAVKAVNGSPDVDMTVYTSESKGVTPPIGVRPQLPRELPPGVKPEELSRIELVILATGIVESVRLVGGPRKLDDTMFLSAVKAWEFRPAMKQGVPVKYRKTIWVVR